MLNKLFVYGTLRAAFDSAMARFLRTRGRLLGQGHLPGYLLDLGRYPGFIPDPTAQVRVEGDIFELYDPYPTLDTLDAYEGIDPARPQEAEYRREKCRIRMPRGNTLCWTYVFTGPADAFPRIPDGCYVTYAMQTGEHRRFLNQGADHTPQSP